MLTESLSETSVAPERIALVGIGGMGTHVLDVADGANPKDFVLASVNLNIRLLETALAPIKIQLGTQLTHGLGAGGDSAIGARAAREDMETLSRLLNGCRIVVFLAGLGGGTGSGVTPVMAKLAKELGVFVVSVVTTPFAFEGQRRIEQAQKALSELSVFSDILLHFDNESMAGLVAGDGSILHAFSESNRLLKKAAFAIPSLASGKGLIQVGLDDLKKVLPPGRTRRCLFGCTSVRGVNRAEEAVPQLMKSPFFSDVSTLRDISDLLIYVTGDPSMGIDELRILMDSARGQLPRTARLHLGVDIDPILQGELSVSCFASTLVPVVSKTPQPIDTPSHEEEVELPPTDDDGSQEQQEEEDTTEPQEAPAVAMDPVIIFSDKDPSEGHPIPKEDEEEVIDDEEDELTEDSEEEPFTEQDQPDEVDDEEQVETIDMDIMGLTSKTRREVLEALDNSSGDSSKEDPFLPPRLRSKG